VVEGPNVVSI